jgi:hypothetical protein
MATDAITIAQSTIAISAFFEPLLNGLLTLSRFAGCGRWLLTGIEARGRDQGSVIDDSLLEHLKPAAVDCPIRKIR